MEAQLNHRFAKVLFVQVLPDRMEVESLEVIDWEDGVTYAWMTDGRFIPLRSATDEERSAHGVEFVRTR